MASQQQVQRNLNDVGSAWGTFQTFINYLLGFHTGINYTYAALFRIRRNL